MENKKNGIYYRLSDFKGGMNIQNKKFLEFKDIDITKKEKPQYKFLVDIEKFNNTSGNCVAYWLSDEYINIFKTSKQLIEIAKPAQGMATGDNKRFVKLWWEVDLNDEFLNSNSAEESKNANKKFVPYNKGGSFRKWYGNNDYILYFKDYGRDIAASSESRFQNSQLYLQQSITWSKISSSPIAFRYKPFGHVFDVAGTSIFGDKDDLDYLLGLCNSIVVMGLLKAISPTLNYEVGQISTIPVKVDKNNDNYKRVNDVVNKNIELSKSDWSSFETSWDFRKHPLV
ncbi:MAG: hypothetical protein J6O09_04185 [Lachnospiraceae bacterium]|nr:hypothetical protein [Lachnospiraceae bacterium]